MPFPATCRRERHGRASDQEADTSSWRDVTDPEYGYALRELKSGVLFPLLVLILCRCGERWAWFACRGVLIATIGGSLAIAAHDHALLPRSLMAPRAASSAASRPLLRWKVARRQCDRSRVSST